MMRGDKCGDMTRHIKFPSSLDEQIALLAAYHRRPFTEMLVCIVDEHINGPREMRLINGKEGRK